MKSAGAQKLYSYWQTLRAGEPAPERRDLDPSAIESMLGDVFILEHKGAADFSYRLAGTRLCSAYRRELKGDSFGSLWRADDLEAIDTLMLAIRQEAAAAVIGFAGVNERGQTMPFETLLLPLKYGGQDYPRILGISQPLDTAYWLGMHPIVSQSITSMRLVWPDERPAFLRRSVNADAPTNFDDDLLSAPQPDILPGGHTMPIGLATSAQQVPQEEWTACNDIRAQQRRQAFRVIAGGLDSN